VQPIRGALPSKALLVMPPQQQARGQKRDFYRRIRQADEDLGDDPLDASALQKRGEAKRKLGLIPEAVLDFDAALAADSKNVLALAGRGSAKRKLGQEREAIKDFDAALLLDPANALVLVGRGAARRQLGQLPEASADVSKAIASGLQSAWAFQLRGEIQRKLGSQEKAIIDFNMALASQPHYVPALAGRGAAKRALGRHKEALQDFNAAIALEPKNTSVLVGRGNTFLDLGSASEAIADFEAALRHEPQDTCAQWSLTVATQKEGPLLARSVTMNGFLAEPLNTKYVERRETEFRVNNLETYWSGETTDGQFFLYWCKKECRWKGSRTKALQKIREGGSSGILGAPVGMDIFASPLIVGWHEWDGSDWAKHADAGVTSIGPAVAVSRAVVLSGFSNPLNVQYIEQRLSKFMVNCHETYWSIDCEFFIFWCSKELRWKVSLADDLDYNRKGGSKAIAAAPASEDILRQLPLLTGWHEWDGEAWMKRETAGVSQLGAFSKASRQRGQAGVPQL